MSCGQVIRECLIGGGIQATVSDETRHYFGGYFHVRIQVKAEVPVSHASFDTSEELDDALRRLGEVVRFSRTLEKMAVPDAELGAVHEELLRAFDANVLPYLSRPDFPARFVRSEYAKALKSAPPSYR